MQSYSLTDVGERYKEVFESATKEPVLLTKESQPSYVIMSANNYQQLMRAYAELQDHVFGKLAQAALSNSQMVGTEAFTLELQRLANFDSDEQ
ncbi:prevent-host-death protein [Iningainema tapete]|uniref:Prevent-host-death protein n=1 Tax=Iningainema tapete BLCC-T55 TaxID=2748662 RepID=A0A8J7C6J3_9CYAN|nr:prevent-host-death protein [Iningainema tapete]MBD2774404.1 prevent-host-death protein [Iningainema tapete BLCC-T55]